MGSMILVDPLDTGHQHKSPSLDLGQKQIRGSSHPIKRESGGGVRASADGEYMKRYNKFEPIKFKHGLRLKNEPNFKHDARNTLETY